MSCLSVCPTTRLMSGPAAAHSYLCLSHQGTAFPWALPLYAPATPVCVTRRLLSSPATARSCHLCLSHQDAALSEALPLHTSPTIICLITRLLSGPATARLSYLCLSLQDAALSEARATAKTLSEAFYDVRAQRTERFTAAFEHIAREIDEIYKQVCVVACLSRTIFSLSVCMLCTCFVVFSVSLHIYWYIYLHSHLHLYPVPRT